MIKSFADGRTEKVWNGERTRLPSDILRRAERKLVQIDSAAELSDLRAPPGNRLEQLSGDREGQHSIRINDQWRICFRWSDDGVYDVEIVDYH